MNIMKPLSRRIIGNGREHEGLYYFEEEESKNKQALVSSCKSAFVSSDQEIMLWHCKLGHPSFSYLKNSFPLLYKNRNKEKKKCSMSTCQTQPCNISCSTL